MPETTVINAIASVWLPTSPPTPCPEILTAEEAVIYLRLNRRGRSMPKAIQALGDYRMAGRIKGAHMGNGYVYRRVDLDEFAEAQTRSK